MFDDSNSYNLRTVISDGVTLYYVSFMDSQGSRRETEVSRPVYLEFLRFVKTERNLRRWNERHAERFDLAENALSERALYPQANIEDAAIDRFRIESKQG